MALSTDIDSTPPERPLDPEVVRFLHENFSRIRDLTAVLDAGQSVSGSFTTADAKTITVVDGIVTSIV